MTRKEEVDLLFEEIEFLCENKEFGKVRDIMMAEINTIYETRYEQSPFLFQKVYTNAAVCLIATKKWKKDNSFIGNMNRGDCGWARSVLFSRFAAKLSNMYRLRCHPDARNVWKKTCEYVMYHTRNM